MNRNRNVNVYGPNHLSTEIDFQRKHNFIMQSMKYNGMEQVHVRFVSYKDYKERYIYFLVYMHIIVSTTTTMQSTTVLSAFVVYV